MRYLSPPIVVLGVAMAIIISFALLSRAYEDSLLLAFLISGGLIVSLFLNMIKSVQESQEKLQQIFASSPDAITVSNLQGIITDCNQATLDLHGYATKEELLGKSAFELIAPRDWQRASDNMHKVLERGMMNNMEYTFLTQDRREFPAEMAASAIRDASGKPSALMAITKDISERKRGEAELKARAHQQAAMAKLGQQALAGTDLGELMEEAVALITQTLELEYCQVAQLMPGGQAVRLRAGQGGKEGAAGQTMVYAGTGSQIGYALLTGEPVIVEDLQHETRFQVPPLLLNLGMISSVSVVIRGKAGPWGILEAYTTQHRVFRQDEINFLQAIANMLGVAIERKQAEEKIRFVSNHDALTGLYNRSFFEEELVRLAGGREFPVSVVIADVDGMKATNDAQGHAAGDELLRQAAALLTVMFRNEDVVARIGGDEFAVVLPNTDVAVAEEALARVKRKLEMHDGPAPGASLSLSLGVATAKRSEDLSEALRLADKCMYQEKLARPCRGSP